MGRKASPAIPSWQRPDTYPAQRIDDEMKSKHISNVAMAEHLNCSPQAVNQYRRGIAFPTCLNLMKIAQKLETTTDYLLGAAECPTPENEKISKILGLADKAITTLREARKGSPVVLDPTIAGINTLLESQEGQSIARLVGAYVHGDFSRAFNRTEGTDWINNATVEAIAFQVGKTDQGVALEIPFHVSSVANAIILEIHEYLLRMREAANRPNTKKEADPSVNPENPE